MQSKLVLFHLVCLTTIVFAGGGAPGCKKKEKKPAKTGNAPAAMQAIDAMDSMAPAMQAKGPATAEAACPKGARPGHPLKKETFEVTVQAPAQAAKGAAAKAEVLVVPRGDYKVNLKYPTSLALKPPPAGVALRQRKLEKAQATELTKARARFQVEYTPGTAGKKVLAGKLEFSVCTPKMCLEEETCVAWETTAQ